MSLRVSGTSYTKVLLIGDRKIASFIVRKEVERHAEDRWVDDPDLYKMFAEIILINMVFYPVNFR